MAGRLAGLSLPKILHMDKSVFYQAPGREKVGQANPLIMKSWLLFLRAFSRPEAW